MKQTQSNSTMQFFDIILFYGRAYPNYIREITASLFLLLIQICFAVHAPPEY
jgi:hypothetical protein